MNGLLDHLGNHVAVEIRHFLYALGGRVELKRIQISNCDACFVPCTVSHVARYCEMIPSFSA